MLLDHPRIVLPARAATLAALLAACGGGGGNPGLTGPTAPSLPAPAPATLTLALREVANGLDNPVFLTAPSGDHRQFIVERTGRIRIMQDGLVLALPFLDISGKVDAAGEGGLLSVAFHPRFAANGLFYIYYTDAAGDIVIEQRKVSANPGRADPVAALEILRIAHPNFLNHYGGLLAFGPDGYLYLGTGDGGGFGDQQGNSQNLRSMLGKMLRIDVDAASVTAPYAIPASNPFAGRAGARGEIWAYGLRNPWRWTFDGGQLYIADVGQERREEVDISPVARGGLNYGWNILEGSLCYNAATCASAGTAAPAFEYDHGAANANGCSIIGGYVYRGLAIPELAGRYFYSDYCAGYLRSFLAGGNAVAEQTDWNIPDAGTIISFGRDADGELYLLTSSGPIYKIVRGGATG